MAYTKFTDVASIGNTTSIIFSNTGVSLSSSPSNGDNSNAIATTSFVAAALSNVVGGNSAVSSVAGRTGNVVLSVTDIANAAPLASPVFTGTPHAPTPTAGDNSLNIATTAFVTTAVSSVSGTPTTAELYNWNPATQLSNFKYARAKVSGQMANARCKVVMLGDSTTAGVGGAAPNSTNYRATGSVTTYTCKYMTAVSNLVTQQDSFFGCGNDPTSDNRVVLVANAAVYSGAAALAGPVIAMTTGQVVTFTPNDSYQYDRVDIHFIDSGGNINISVDGANTITSVATTGSGNMKFQTVNLTLGYHVLYMTGNSSTTFFLEGASFWKSTAPTIEVYNGGSGGAEASGSTGTTGYGSLQGAVAVQPCLTFVNFGINEINNGDTTASQYQTNITTIVSTLQNASCDVILVMPHPFGTSSNYSNSVAQFRAALHSISTTYNVPVLDLGNRYNNNYTGLSNAGLIYSGPHPNQYFYSDIGFHYANILASI
jgi:lysophospholipase L1-like esterase